MNTTTGAPAWPFEYVDQGLYRCLTPNQKIQAQVHMEDDIAKILASSKTTRPKLYVAFTNPSPPAPRTTLKR